MNLQQLKYIVAINRFRNFARAAEACQVSQPTLSAMLVKLEEELDTRIFERNNKTVSPTTPGKKIIRQAETVLQEIERIPEIVMEDKGEMAEVCRSPWDQPLPPTSCPSSSDTIGKTIHR